MQELPPGRLLLEWIVQWSARLLHRIHASFNRWLSDQREWLRRILTNLFVDSSHCDTVFVVPMVRWGSLKNRWRYYLGLSLQTFLYFGLNLIVVKPGLFNWLLSLPIVWVAKNQWWIGLDRPVIESRVLVTDRPLNNSDFWHIGNFRITFEYLTQCSTVLAQLLYSCLAN